MSYPQNLQVSIKELSKEFLWDLNNDTLRLNLITKGFSDTKEGAMFFMFNFQSIGFFESLFARNKVIDSRFVEEEITL